MKSLFTLSLLVFSTTLGFSQAHNQPCDKPGKVLVCHLPPGNPENVQEICISENAVAAHLAHGCFVGSCSRVEESRVDAAWHQSAIADFVAVYPNPFNETLSIEMVFEDNTEAEIGIYDMKGTLVAMPFKGLSESSFIMDYNTDKLATGMYLVRVITPTKVRTFKMSKNL